MAFDEILAGQVRTLLVDESDVTEKRMFGGLAFLVAGHMAVAVSGGGGLMVRTAPSEAQAPYFAHAEPMVMNGRELAGWVLMPAEPLTDEATLAAVVGHARAFARTLPAK